ncbi:MAG: flavin reductase family protein [Alphaproteobacteria bacterium]|nr:flavin reductase family protein [Alphaproteobacteria bacterium]
MNEDLEKYKLALSNFATGVAIATVNDQDDLPIGVTINSFNSVSLTPNLILFSLDKKNKYLKYFLSCTYYGINILSDHQINLSKKFSKSSQAKKWEDVNYKMTPNNVAVIDDNLSFFECTHHAIHEGGDHLIFVGQVINFNFDENQNALLYFRKKYCDIFSNS